MVSELDILKQTAMKNELDKLKTDSLYKSTHEYARQFKTCYVMLRKGTTMLYKNRKELGNQATVEQMRYLLASALDTLK